MSLEEIQTTIVEVLKAVQKLNGKEWYDLPLTAKPILDMDGFDSLCSVEATIMIEEKLGCGELSPPSIFISEEGNHPLSILEISKFVEKLIKKGIKK